MYFDSHAHLGEDCFAQDFVNIVEKMRAANVTGTGTNFPGLHISVHNAPGTKCPRCWMHSEQADPETGLCPRCAAVVAAQKAE